MADDSSGSGQHIYGDGSIVQNTLRGEKRWQAQLFVPGRKHPVRKTLPRGASEADARRELRILRDMRARGELTLTRAERRAAEPAKLPTVRQVVDAWLAAGCPAGRGRPPSPRTRGSYERTARLAIDPRPAFAGLAADELRRRHVADLLADVAATEGWARDTLKELRGILQRAWRHTQVRYEDELGHRANPADVDLPLIDEAETDAGRALPADEITDLLAAVAGHRLLDARVVLGLDTGMRPGELAALERPHLDLTSTPATVLVVQSISWHDVLDSAGKPVRDEKAKKIVRAVLTDTKTGAAGHRRLTLSPRAVAVMREHDKRMAAAQLKARGYWPTEQDGIDIRNLMFKNAKGGILTDNAVGGPLTHLCKTRQLPHVKPYDLRHTAATVIARAYGRDHAGKVLGHVPTGGGKVTGTYIHEELETTVAAALDLALTAVDNTVDTGTGE